jgi:hypothetical protein
VAELLAAGEEVAELPAAGEEVADPVALGEPAPADGTLLHAAVGRAVATVVRMAAAIRIAGGLARRGGRSTGAPSCVVGFMSPVLRARR